jgi:hypothetical protein
MRRFLGAMEQIHARPILLKNNSLNACAALVAEVFERSFFICMTRDPVFLAQSQLRARLDIHGRADVPYGLAAAPDSGDVAVDEVENVCRQVLYHQRLALEQRRRIGAERFWIVEYEEFCRNPSALIDAVAVKVLGQPCPPSAKHLAPFKVANAVRIDHRRFQEIAATLARLEATSEAAEASSLRPDTARTIQ